MQSSTDTRKSRILLAATELFVACEIPSTVETNVFAELFRQYIDTTPVEERRRIASLLARCDHAPHETVLRLMRDEDASVAHRIVAYSKVLNSCDLVSAISRGPEALRRAVALRPELPEDVMTALTRYAAPDTLQGLEDAAHGPVSQALQAAPPTVAPRPQTPAMDALADSADATSADASPAAAAARDMSDLAEAVDRELSEILRGMQDETDALLARAPERAERTAPAQEPALEPAPEPAAETATAPRRGDLAFLHASTQERANLIAAAQARVMAEMATGQRAARFEADQPMLSALERAALARDRESFLGVLAPMLDVDADTAERITLDAGGEPLTVALAALGLATSRSVSIILQMSPAVNDISRLREISALRSNLDPRTARRVAADWRRTPAISAETAHQPLLDAADRIPRTAARPAVLPADQARPDRTPTRDDVLVLRDIAN